MEKEEVQYGQVFCEIETFSTRTGRMRLSANHDR
ncbi:hypothetical protein COLO4_19366 [Corchorus olitorius]|uniref:Uncharacterized protein n=1 Tax=Corchorus olitorius TaxID=93759 RepID=A0A1R3J5I3_9ROSI|nr:hypothetical protein COLO4_19366 [Corchorus olitorius]